MGSHWIPCTELELYYKTKQLSDLTNRQNVRQARPSTLLLKGRPWNWTPLYPNDPENINNAAFKTKYGAFKFLLKPMGLKNAPATFLVPMNSIFSSILLTALSLSILTTFQYSATQTKTTIENIRALWFWPQEQKLYVRKNKSQLMCGRNRIPGVLASHSVVTTGEGGMTFVSNWHKPTKITELRSSLGFLPFSLHFVRDFEKWRFHLPI